VYLFGREIFCESVLSVVCGQSPAGNAV